MDQYEIATAMLIDEYVSISILGLEFFLVIDMRRLSTYHSDPNVDWGRTYGRIGGYNFGRYSVISSVISFNISIIMAFGGIALYSLSKERIQL